MNLLRGKVKWFNNDKGFGFIEQASGMDVFVHFSAIEPSEDRTLMSTGQDVTFTIVDGRKGPQADQVKISQS